MVPRFSRSLTLTLFVRITLVVSSPILFMLCVNFLSLISRLLWHLTFFVFWNISVVESYFTVLCFSVENCLIWHTRTFIASVLWLLRLWKGLCHSCVKTSLPLLIILRNDLWDGSGTSRLLTIVITTGGVS